MDIVRIMPVPGIGYWLLVSVVAVALIAIHLCNLRNRNAVGVALRKASGGLAELKAWSLCMADSIDLKKFTLLPPERLFCYDRSYIIAFVALASQQTTEFGDTALRRYLTPTLIWNDVFFALLLSLLTCLVVLAMPSFCPQAWVEWGSRAALFFAAMALTYAAVDIAEDFRLARLLSADPAPDAQAVRQTLILTRIKMASLTASVVGAAIFALLLAVSALWPKSSMEA